MALKMVLACLTLYVVLLKVVPATDHTTYGCFPTGLQHWCDAFSPFSKCLECNRIWVEKVVDTTSLDLTCPTPQGKINVTSITYYIEKNWQAFQSYCLKRSKFDWINCSTTFSIFNCCIDVTQFSENQCSHSSDVIPEWNCSNNCTVNVKNFWFNLSMCRGLRCDTKSNTSNSCYSTLVRIDYKCTEEILGQWNTEKVIGIVFGCLTMVVIIIVIVVIYKCCKRLRNARNKKKLNKTESYPFIDVKAGSGGHQEASEYIEDEVAVRDDTISRADGDSHSSFKSSLQEIKEQLKKAYENNKYGHIEALPGETFILDLKKELKKERFFMPLVFQTKVRKTNKQSDYMSEKKYHYETYHGSIEEIIGSLLKPPSEGNEDVSRVVLITAEAGCGKTVSIHKMVCQWMDESDPHLAQFDIVIAIPLRNVDTDESLTSILSDAKSKSSKHKGGLHYVKGKYTIESLDDYLRGKKEQSDKMLILLDGADEVEIEKESDIFNLITGDSFPHIKLVITSRPERKLLQTLENFYPDYKISITGTNEEGVHEYLKEMMTKERGPSQDEFANLIKKCKEEMASFDLLKVPLYLTLVGVMFIDHWAQYANFTGFQVPTTKTALLCSFLRILLSRWIKRDSRYKHIKQGKFGRNPYDETNIPNDILDKLHNFANMSYFILEKEIYDFTTKDLKKYFIDTDDIIDSGLFCHSRNTFFYRHKLLQEFMAALYLIHPMCTETFKTPTKQGTFEKIIYKSDTFIGLKNIPTFVFGMSPQHAMDIILKLKGQLILEISKDEDSRMYGIDITPPLELRNECNDNNVTNALMSLLSESKVCFTDDGLPKPDISLYKTFFSSITTDQAVTLLLSWYNIHVYPIVEGWAVKNGDNSNTVINDVIYDSSDRSLIIKYLDITLMLLLQRFTLPQVHSLFVKHSWYNVLDMITIEKMFPNIIKLYVDGDDDSEDCDIKLNIPGNTTHQLTSLQHISYRWLKYSPQSQQLLLQQSKLETLYVRADLIHGISNRQQQQPYWPKLHTLQLYIYELLSDKQSDSSDPHVCDVSDLCHLLKGVPQLTVLSLIGGQTSDSTMTTLLQCIQEHLTHLNKLHLYYMLDSQTLPMIFPVIVNMKQLTNLGLDYDDIDGNIDSLVDGLSSVNNIKQLEILYGRGPYRGPYRGPDRGPDRGHDRGEAQTIMNATIQYMNSHYPDISIKVRCTEWHRAYLQPELPDPLPQW